MAADKMPGPEAVDSDVAFDPAVAWFQKRLGMTRAQVDALALEYRRKVFFVTGLSDLEAIKAVQDSLARALENGATFEEWKAQVKEKGLFRGPQFTKARLETIFRTNMQNAFATGRYMELTAPAVLKRRPYWRFSAVRDNRTTKVCAASHGTILPASHEWWKTHIPPLHFNCRSTFVPMTEKDAKAAGITKNPTQLKAALGFGNPPFGVPAAARDLPTEAQREAAEKVSEEVQTAVEERQNASSKLTAAKHEKSVADRKLREAKKELIRAPQKDVPARKKDVEEAQKAAEAAGKHVEKAKEVLEKTQKNTEETLEKHKGQPTFWGLIKERLKRIAKGVAKGAVSVMGSILGPFRKFKNAVLDGAPVLEGVTPDGQKIYFGRGDITRAPMMRYAGNAQRPPRQPKTPSVAPKKSKKKQAGIGSSKTFQDFIKSTKQGENNYTLDKNEIATGVVSRRVEFLEGLVPRDEFPDFSKKETKVKDPAGSRHKLPPSKKEIIKEENTMYHESIQNAVFDDIKKIRKQKALPVKITTTFRNTRETDTEETRSIIRYGYYVQREGSGRLYALQKNDKNPDSWHTYPVAGTDFVQLNRKERQFLDEMIFDGKTIEDVETECEENHSADPTKIKKAFDVSSAR